MTDDFQLFPEPADLDAAAPSDADTALITAYLAGELTWLQAIAVDDRLASDAAFYTNGWPVIEGWMVPGSLKSPAPVSAPRMNASSLTRAEIDAGWVRHLQSRTATPATPAAMAAPGPRVGVRDDREKPTSRWRIAAVVSLIVLPIVGAAQWMVTAANHADMPGHAIAESLVKSLHQNMVAAPRPVESTVVVHDQQPSATPLTLTPRDQGPMPARPLGRIVATSAVFTGEVHQARQLPDGRVLVNDAGRSQLFVLDSGLAHPLAILEKGGYYEGFMRGGTAVYAAFIAFRGDSILFPRNQAGYWVLDRSLKVVGQLPRGAHLSWNAPSDGWERWAPGLGLVYPSLRAYDHGCEPADSTDPPCTGHIIAWDPDRGVTDTLATYYYPSAGDDFATTADHFTVMADGSIAILHSRSYRVEWINRDRSHTLGPPIPYDWHLLTARDRTRLADSLNAEHDSPVGVVKRLSNPRGAPLKIDAAQLPDSIPPVQRGSFNVLVADLDNRLWIRSGAWITPPGQPATYDIVNRAGVLVDRVQVPADRTVIGFGVGGIVLLASQTGTTYTIQKVLFR